MKKILIRILLGRRDNYFDVVRIGDRKMILHIEEYISAEQMIRSSRKETISRTVEDGGNSNFELKGISTEELINELSSRSGVKKISVGLYQPYELKRKYYRERLSDEEVYVEAREVLVIQN